MHIRKYFWKKRGEKPRPGTDGFCVILREFGDIARGLALLFKKTLPAGNFRTFERSFLIDKAEELAAAAASLDEARREVQKFVDEPSKNHREALSKKAAAEDAPAPSAHDIADFVDVCATPLLNFTYARMLEHIYEQELGKMREDRPSAAFNGDGDDAPPPSKRRRGNGVPKPDAAKDTQ